VINKDSKIELIISTPMFEEFIQSLVMGLFENQMMEIDGAHGQRIKFPIMVVTRVPEPEFSSEMHYRTLSPLVLKTVIDGEKGRQTYYYRPYDKGLAGAVANNLLGKYQTIHGTLPLDQNLDFQLDETYIKKRGGPEKISNLITLHKGQDNATQIKGFSCPFVLKGSKALIETAWHAGIGDHTGMGFGCVEIAKK
jgi:CRISPR-associated endoribonuclease Cas6